MLLHKGLYLLKIWKYFTCVKIPVTHKEENWGDAEPVGGAQRTIKEVRRDFFKKMFKADCVGRKLKRRYNCLLKNV